MNAQMLEWLTRIVIFLSAFLLFSIQPLITKFILPGFGGTYSVWTMVIFFFTTSLLLGYVYASIVISWPHLFAKVVHSGIVFAAAVSVVASWLAVGTPIIGNSIESANYEPAIAVLLTLLSLVGLPTLVLASNSVVVQSVYTNLTGNEPYPLYALSNAGSLAGLLTYPFLVELWFPLSLQIVAWSVLFLLLIFLLLILIHSVPMTRVALPLQEQRKNSAVDHPLGFVARAAIPTFFLAASTEYLTKSAASFPLLWVVPLAAYLLSFVVAFRTKRSVLPKESVVVLAGIFLPMFLLITLNALPGIMYWFFVALTTLSVFVLATYIHTRIFEERPEPARMGKFYVLLTTGGALGSGIVGLVLPLLLGSNHELMWFLFLAILFVGWHSRLLFVGRVLPVWKKGLLLLTGFSVLALFLYSIVSLDPVATRRNFYGTLSVFDVEVRNGSTTIPIRQLVNGSIVHGLQSLEETTRLHAVGYYGPDSGIGVSMQSFSERGVSPKMLVVGAGVGTLSSYCDSLSKLDYVEINPAVIDVASDYFTYLAYCHEKGTVTIDDGRLYLESKEKNEQYDLIVVDAFTDDSIPIHLLTVDAFRDAYQPHLSKEGMIVIHVTNRYLDLSGVVAGSAHAIGYIAVRVDNRVNSDEKLGLSSTWMLVMQKEKAEDFLVNASVRQYTGKDIIWTDERSSVLEALSLQGSRHGRGLE